MGKKTLSIFLSVIFFISSYGLAQDASDIIVPSGFRVEKVLDTNRCPDPQNIAFLPSGEFLVANMFWRIQQVSPEGAITTRAKFLTNNGPMPFDIQVTPEGEIYFTSTDRLN